MSQTRSSILRLRHLVSVAVVREITESPGWYQGSQGRRETFSLVCRCPHPSNVSPIGRILLKQLLVSNQRVLNV